MTKHAIVGFGCAGYQAARAIRRYDPGAVIDVYDRTGQPPFNPMLSTYYAAERLSREAVFPFGTLESIQRELSLGFRAEAVERVDAAGRTVCTQGGSAERYDKILIATGASALTPRFIRYAGERFFVMRTLADALRLKNYLANNPVRRAAVVGGSMVGVKVAELLHERQVETTVVDAADYLFPLAAYEDVARRIQSRLEGMGLRFAFHAPCAAIDERGVTLQDGGMIPADIVCLCVGTRANLELVANIDVVRDSAVAIGRGVIVNTRMESSVPDIYAAGDCCEGVNLQTGKTAIIGLWANAGAQGACAGANMAGAATEYYGSILHNITHFFGMDFIGLGDATLPGERHSFSGDGYTVDLTMDGARLNSVNILGCYQISGILKNYLTRQLLGAPAGLTPAQRGLMEAHGLGREIIDLLEGIK